jgi:hypothetical protein
MVGIFVGFVVGGFVGGFVGGSICSAGGGIVGIIYGIVGGFFGVVYGSLAGGVVGMVVGGSAVVRSIVDFAGTVVVGVVGVADVIGEGISSRNRDLRGPLGATSAVSGLMAGAGWRTMRAAARLMPRAAGSRWLAEAESFLYEAPPIPRRGAIRSYLIGALQVIAVSWAGELARRTRPPR